MPRTSHLYKSFADQLTGIVSIASDPAIDGTYWMADCYSDLMDDRIFEAVKDVARLHLGGQCVQPTQASTTLKFLTRLRCVDSLSDYLILAIQAVAEGHPFNTARWARPDLADMETGHLDGEHSVSSDEAVVSVVHIADLIEYSKLNLNIPAKQFPLFRAAPDEARQEARNERDAPPYCFVSHAWVDNGMPDSEDGKFYRAFVLMALSIYIDTGIEYFWIDYVCVTQDPSKRALKVRQISQIPTVVRSSSYQLNMCLEIYQYHTSAWCTLETLLFLAENKYCNPIDFIEHIDRSRFRFGMNVVDSTKVNANEKILYSFTDAPLQCGSPDDVEFLNCQIAQAKNHARVRVWRMASRRIKTAVGLERTDVLGILVTEPVKQFLIGGGQSKSAEQTLDEIVASFSGIVGATVTDAMKDELVRILQNSWELMFSLNGIGYFRPDTQMVTPRQGDVYMLDTSQLTTSYAFHNQRISPD